MARWLGDLPDRSRPRVAAGRDDVTDERPTRDDADELVAFADEDRAHLRPRQQLPRLLCRGVAAERPRLGHHRITDAVH